MNEIRRTFLQTGRSALAVIRDPDVGARWDEPSALPEFTVRGLAGHLKRATGSVEAYLDRDEPDGHPISGVEYYAAATADPDQHGTAPNLNSPLHKAIRQRGEDEAAEGHAALVALFEDLLDRLERRLPEEPDDRKVRVFKDLILTLDNYLVSRLVESLVHADDLAVSIGREPPEMPKEAFDRAIGLLVDLARRKHGDIAVLRALTRRERDAVQALRVL